MKIRNSENNKSKRLDNNALPLLREKLSDAEIYSFF